MRPRPIRCSTAFKKPRDLNPSNRSRCLPPKEVRDGSDCRHAQLCRRFLAGLESLLVPTDRSRDFVTDSASGRRNVVLHTSHLVLGFAGISRTRGLVAGGIHPSPPRPVVGTERVFLY